MTRPIYMRLPHDATDERKRYSMPDPDALREAFEAAYDATYYASLDRGPTVTVDRETMARLLALASGYLTLTTDELGQEHCVGKLRDIWRARRARMGEP